MSFTNSAIIKNISYNQKEILYNIAQLYNNGEPFECDMTASDLVFYKSTKYDDFIVPEPKILFDVFPKQDKIQKIEPFGKLPLEDEYINSIVIDLPFIIKPNTNSNSLIFNRFGGYKNADELYRTYYHWLSEAYRVLIPNGIVVFKCQSTIDGGIQHNTEEFSFMAAQKLGFVVVDKFILAANKRMLRIGNVKQNHARKYTSVFYVFRKPTISGKRLKSYHDYFRLINECIDYEKSIDYGTNTNN